MAIADQTLINNEVNKVDQEVESDTNIIGTNNNNDKNIRPEKITIETLTKYIACFSALCTILSIIGMGFIKYISIGRCMYFQFDIEYYDFSLSVSSIFIFIFFLMCSFIAVLQSYIINKIYVSGNRLVDKKSKQIKIVTKFLIITLLFIFEIVATNYLYKISIPDRGLAYEAKVITLIFCLYIIFFTFAICGDDNNKKAKGACIISLILVLIIAFAFLKEEYNIAKNQREFSMISVGNDYYVVISKGSTRYSAYKCRIEDGKLIIITDDHKYFDINSTNTEPVKFNKIKTEKKPVKTSDEYISQKKS